MHKVRRARLLTLFLPVALWAVLAVACGADPTEAPLPTATAIPTTLTPIPTPAPTPEATRKVASSFADYWNPPTDFYGQPVYGGTVRINYEDPLEHANTWGASTGAATRLRGAVHSRIVSPDPWDDTKIIPDLAWGWSLKADATGVAFFFNEGVKWHNGADFTCEDARFTIETWLTGEGITASSGRASLAFVDVGTTMCLDELTLDVGFTGPNAVALLAFSGSNRYIFNKAWFEAGGEDAMFQDLSVGTGAFVWAPGQTIGFDEQRFGRNPNYFFGGGDGALPYLDEVVLFGILDESAQQAAQLAHQTDWHWVRNFGQYAAYVDHDEILTVIRASRGHHTLWLNRRNAPLDNVRVR